MALASLSDLVKFKRGGKDVGWPPGYPVEDCLKFYAPADRVDGALQALVWSVEHSLIMAVPGLYDPVVTDSLLEKMRDKNILVQLTVQAPPTTGIVRADLLTQYSAMPSNSVTYGGTFSFGEYVIDGLDSATSGSDLLIVTRHAMVAAETRKQLDMLHQAVVSPR